MKLTLFAAACFFLLVTACERSSVTNETDDATSRNTTDLYIVPVNGCASITNVPGNVEICLDSVTFDNRCPPNLVCITGGEALCRFKVNTSSGSQTITLIIGRSAAARQAELFHMRITLQDLLPYRHYPATYTYNDYKAYIKVVPI